METYAELQQIRTRARLLANLIPVDYKMTGTRDGLPVCCLSREFVRICGSVSDDGLFVVESHLTPIAEYTTRLPPDSCTCHEWDSSYVCEACRASGLRGHMQRGE